MKRQAVLVMVAAGALASPAFAAEGEAPGVFSGPLEGLIAAMTTLIIFIFLVAVLGRYAWGPIVTGLKAREERIRQDIEEAEVARRRAEETLNEYNARLTRADNEVRQLLANATAEGEKIAARIQQQAQQDAEQIRQRALRDIDMARKQALAEIYEQAAELSTQIASRILSRSINADDQRELVRQSLAQLETAGASAN